MTAFAYDRNALKPRLAHLGFGAFARAHTMLYLDETLRQTQSDWGAVAIRLNSGAAAMTALDEAQRSYTVAEAEGTRHTLRPIGAVIATAHAKRDRAAAVITRLAEAEIVTLTITEKGYCLTDGALDLSHPQVQGDLAQPERPSTAIGFLTAALAQRRAAGGSGQTIISCDNLPMNGRLCETAVLSFAQEQDPALADWIRSHCCFPCTMVDRIVPAMDRASTQQLTTLLNRPDPNGIICEPFRQWVIEDRFAGDRPAWETAGAQIVPDVAPYEDMKLRMLNGAHSALAYLGTLHGHGTVADCMADPVFKAATRALMLGEQAPTLKGFEAHALEAYADALLQRFANTALKHQLLQIAQDGSQKLPQRLLTPMMEAPQNRPLSALAVAGWITFCHARAGQLVDPLSDEIKRIAKHSTTATLVQNMLALDTVFPQAFRESSTLTAAVAEAFAQLQTLGPRESLAAALVQKTAP